jgi:hypothetical protein
MSAADRSGGLLVVALVGTLVGCAGSDCSDPVVTGDYTLTIVPLLAGGTYGERFELAANGTFSGHLGTDWLLFPGDPRRCDGVVTPEESERLADAINGGQFFCRGNTYDHTITEHPYSDFELRTIDGTRANQFCGHIVPAYRDAELSALAGAARAPLERVRDSGGCMGELYEVPTRTEACPFSRPPEP